MNFKNELKEYQEIIETELKKSIDTSFKNVYNFTKKKKTRRKKNEKKHKNENT